MKTLPLPQRKRCGQTRSLREIGRTYVLPAIDHRQPGRTTGEGTNMRRVAAQRAIVVGLLVISSLFAQRDLATITGTITDAQNASVANAKVTISEDATGLKYETATGAGGEYSRPALKPGTYTVEVEAPGFKKTAQ